MRCNSAVLYVVLEPVPDTRNRFFVIERFIRPLVE
jgi:hypothetical protein